jgi:hypothetical protein
MAASSMQQHAVSDDTHQRHYTRHLHTQREREREREEGRDIIIYTRILLLRLFEVANTFI